MESKRFYKPSYLSAKFLAPDITKDDASVPPPCPVSFLQQAVAYLSSLERTSASPARHSTCTRVRARTNERTRRSATLQRAEACFGLQALHQAGIGVAAIYVPARGDAAAYDVARPVTCHRSNARTVSTCDRATQRTGAVDVVDTRVRAVTRDVARRARARDVSGARVGARAGQSTRTSGAAH